MPATVTLPETIEAILPRSESLETGAEKSLLDDLRHMISKNPRVTAGDIERAMINLEIVALQGTTPFAMLIKHLESLIEQGQVGVPDLSDLDRYFLKARKRINDDQLPHLRALIKATKAHGYTMPAFVAAVESQLYPDGVTEGWSTVGLAPLVEYIQATAPDASPAAPVSGPAAAAIDASKAVDVAAIPSVTPDRIDPDATAAASVAPPAGRKTSILSSLRLEAEFYHELAKWELRTHIPSGDVQVVCKKRLYKAGKYPRGTMITLPGNLSVALIEPAEWAEQNADKGNLVVGDPYEGTEGNLPPATPPTTPPTDGPVDELFTLQAKLSATIDQRDALDAQAVEIQRIIHQLLTQSPEAKAELARQVKAARIVRILESEVAA